ncbi:MAG: tyrosine-type recombinase/integrase [Planctomycetaceae bacterium]|nr:tyrosine-type recombinase/integrase [Planctomycetaceae bacterium]
MAIPTPDLLGLYYASRDLPSAGVNSPEGIFLPDGEYEVSVLTSSLFWKDASDFNVRLLTIKPGEEVSSLPTIYNLRSSISQGETTIHWSAGKSDIDDCVFGVWYFSTSPVPTDGPPSETVWYFSELTEYQTSFKQFSPCYVAIAAMRPGNEPEHRREDAQVMHPALVTKFKEWVARKKVGPDDFLFPISQKTCGTERSVSKVIEFDLSAARTFWIAESETEEEEKRREASDFLRHKNSAGKYADFHSLRHTFITNLVRAKVSPKAAQTLARHSDISLTMNVYTHITEEEQIEAINSLPGIASLEKDESL